MRFLALPLVALLVATATSSLAAGLSYQKPTLIAAQEALARLGYDVGTPSGKWDAKTRAALNALRSKNALPAAETFTGSSLALIHKVSPGATTLPHPGRLVTDVVARRTFLRQPENRSLAAACGRPINPSQKNSLKAATTDPVAVVGTRSTAGKMIEKDFYSPIMVSLIWHQGRCVAGEDSECQAIIDFVSSWARADALRSSSKFGQARFEDDSWAADVILRNSIIAFAHARNFVTMSPSDEATILDWLKRRVDDYHFAKPESIANHALAQMTPAMVFGLLVGDRSMTEPAQLMWRAVLKGMRADGSLPDEMKRGAWALHYQIAQISQLIAVAELAASQDIDLYATAPSAQKSVQQSVSFLLSSLENLDIYYRYAKVRDAAGDDDEDYRTPRLFNFHFGWLPAYYERFGEDANISRMRTSKVDRRMFGYDAGTFADALPILGLAAHHFMGYPAACLQGSVPWPLTKT